jgi:monoamine oxidase
MRCDVVIIGGGVAGLAAAGRLCQAGRRIILCEARDRLGGRIHTVLDPVLGHPVELGAEFVQGSPSEFLQLIARAGLGLHEVFEEHHRARRGVERPLPPIETLVDRLLASAHPDQQDVPVAQLIRQGSGKGFTADELDAATGYLEGFHAADLERFGTAALSENQAAEAEDGDGLFRLVGGYGKLVAHLVSQLDPDLVRVRTQVVVTEVRWRPGTVVVKARDAGGDSIELLASQAVLALPLGNLKVGGEAEGAVSLDPVPPGWEKSLGSLEVGAAQRIDLRFDAAWWMEQNRVAPVFIHGWKEPFRVWWTTSPPEIPILTGWVGGPRAAALAGRGQDELVEKALSSASSIFGIPRATLEDQLQAVYAHDWSTDPFARGAYSYGGVGALGAKEALRRPVAATLFMTGEAIAPAGRNATVPGALFGGLATAAAVLKEPVTTALAE